MLFTGLTSPHFCACPKQGFGYPTPYVFNDLRREVIGRFVNNREIVDHCFLFIIVHNQQLIPQAGEAKYNYYTPGALRHTS